MRPSFKDMIATLLVAAIVVPFIGYVGWGSMPFIEDPTGMAGVALGLGVVAAVIAGWITLRSGVFLRIATVGTGLVSLGLGITALVSEHLLDVTTRDGLLGACIATIVVLWALATLHHSGAMPSATGRASRLGHA